MSARWWREIAVGKGREAVPTDENQVEPLLSAAAEQVVVAAHLVGTPRFAHYSGLWEARPRAERLSVVARMQRSAVRGNRSPRHPGFRCAPSRLRLLNIRFRQRSDGLPGRLPASADSAGLRKTVARLCRAIIEQRSCAPGVSSARTASRRRCPPLCGRRAAAQVCGARIQ